jgi:hypothetical protein
MVVAEEEGYLDDILGEYGMRLRWAKTADTSLPNNLDPDSMSRLIPRFSSVVADLVSRGLIEVWKDEVGGTSVAGSELSETLCDHRAWIRDDGAGSMMFCISVTEAWRDLAAE